MTDVCLIMKKFLSLALVAVMLVACVAIAAVAEAPKAEEFTANNGFYIFDGKANNTGVQDPPEMADTEKGLQIVHGGYYQSGDNCGGVVSTGTYNLDGFEATIFFETAPEVTPATDCWVAVDFLAEARPFFTGNFILTNGGNQGILDLIRFGHPYLEVYEGISNFGQPFNSQDADPADNAVFSIVSGTTLTVKLARNENNNYVMTFSQEGCKDFTVPYEFPMSDVFPEGKAHFSVIASCEIAPEDGWTYYITDIKDGAEMPEEMKKENLDRLAAIAYAANLEEAEKIIASAEEKIKEAVERIADSGVEDAIARGEEGLKAIEDAKAAMEAGDFDAVKALVDEAENAAVEAKQFAKNVEDAVEDAVEGAEDTVKDAAENVEQAAASAGFPIWLIIVIAVVIIAIVAVILATKKKN